MGVDGKVVLIAGGPGHWDERLFQRSRWQAPRSLRLTAIRLLFGGSRAAMEADVTDEADVQHLVDRA